MSLYGSYFSFSLVKHLLESVFYTFVYNAYHYGSWILTLLLGVVLAFRIRKSSEKFRPLLWTVAASVVFAGFHILLRGSVRPWYLQSAFVLTLPLVALCFEKINWKITALGAALILYLSGVKVWSPVFYQKIMNMRAMAGAIERGIPATDRVGSFNSGLYQYLSDRKVINLDGLVNNEVLPYYKRQNGLDYLRKREIKWLVDFPPFITHIFGPYLGTAAESSLAYAGGVRDTSMPINSIWLVMVLADTLYPPPDRIIPINRTPQPWRYGPIPIPFLRD